MRPTTAAGRQASWQRLLLTYKNNERKKKTLCIQLSRAASPTRCVCMCFCFFFCCLPAVGQMYFKRVLVALPVCLPIQAAFVRWSAGWLTASLSYSCFATITLRICMYICKDICLYLYKYVLFKQEMMS